MKCVFRTIRKVRYLHPEFDNPVDYDEIVEFAECMGKECPYYGERYGNIKDPLTGKQKIFTDKICRRLKNDIN